jgi:type II secretory pathway pseudopilin PulG
MNSDLQSRTKHQPGRTLRGLTLVEILVSIAIAVVLTGIVLVSGQSVRRSRMRAGAEQQMTLIAAAIEQYAAFWPRWEVINGTEKVVLADKGWPDFIPGRLFAPSAFVAESGFNDHGVSFDVTAISCDPGTQSWGDPGTPALTGDILDANACLVYCLTSAAGKGPFVSDKSGSDVTVDIANVHKQSTPAMYPPYGVSTAVKHRQVFVDPWGTPYRYFWVYRDPEPDATQKAYKGVLPVDFGPYRDGAGAEGVGNPAFFNIGVPKKAASFVLESAGPNKKFGNVWKKNPTPAELDDAWDNLTIMP